MVECRQPYREGYTVMIKKHLLFASVCMLSVYAGTRVFAGGLPERIPGPREIMPSEVEAPSEEVYEEPPAEEEKVFDPVRDPQIEEFILPPDASGDGVKSSARLWLLAAFAAASAAAFIIINKIKKEL